MNRLLIAVVFIGYALADVSEILGSGANQKYTLEQAIRGTPNSDYPIYSEPPKTSFSCDKKDFGYYVDIEARCQVFRVCAHTDTSGMGFTFLCPNGTLFNQQYMVCDWYYNVNCEESEKYFGMNQVLGKTDGSDAKIMAEVKRMMENPFKASDRSGNGRATFQPNQNPFAPPFGDNGRTSSNRPNNDGFSPIIPSFTGNGPQQGFVSGIPTRGGTIPPSVGDGPIFVSNLGELSTDPDSAFDRKKSNVISVSSDSDDPTKAAAGTQVLTYPTNGRGGGASGSRTGRKKKGNGYERGGPNVSINSNSFPELSDILDDSIRIGGTKSKGSRTTAGVSRNKELNNNRKTKHKNTSIKASQENSEEGHFDTIATYSEETLDDYDEYVNHNDKKKTSRPRLPKPGTNKNSEPGFGLDDLDQASENQNSENHNKRVHSSTQTFSSRKSSQPSFGKHESGGNSRNIPSNERDEIFSIVYSVLNERHGGFDDQNGAQRRSDNFKPAPPYEILPSIDISDSIQHGFSIPGFNGQNGQTTNTHSSRHIQSTQNQNNRKFSVSNNNKAVRNSGQFTQRTGGVEIYPARLISQTSSNGRNQQNYFPASSNQQPRRQRPSQRRSGPNIEIVPVPLKHISSSSITNPEGESTNNQPYAIPNLVKNIKANNFLLNYNPLLSNPTASGDEVLVQIIKAEDTYVNDGSGRARPINGANESNTKSLPPNFAKSLPGTSQTGAVTPFEITGGRPSSYDVPLNSVGPLEQERINSKSTSFKGYQY